VGSGDGAVPFSRKKIEIFPLNGEFYTFWCMFSTHYA